MKSLRRIASVLISLMLCFNMVIPAAAANTLGITYSATLDNSTITVSDAPQTVVMTISTNEACDLDGLGMVVVYDEALTLTAIENSVLGFTASNINLGNGKVNYATADAENISASLLAEVTFTVPANTPAGSYSVGVEELSISKDFGDQWEKGGSVSTTLTIKAAEAPHEHSYTSVVTAPTCTAGGYTTYTCECGDSYIGNEIDKLGHDYQAVVTDATCTADGKTVYTCSRCSDSYEETITSPGHNYESVVTAPTCTEDGYTTYTCSVCGDSYVGDKVAFSGHSYTGAVTAPTCTDDGYTTYTCSACGDSYVANKVAAKGHDYKSELTEGNCETGGVLTYTCTVCGHSYTETLEAEGHNYESVVTAPTCTEDGYTTHTCSKCGDSYTDTPVEKLGHNYESVVTAPTCTEDGYTTHTCSVCGDTYTDTPVEKLGHDYDSVVTAPTCTAEGYTTYTCSVCGDSYTGDPVEKLPHDYDSVVTAPTCTEDGYTTYTCSVCGDSYTGDPVEKLPHDYDSVVTAPTCTEDGYTTHTCSVCGDSYTDTPVEKLGHIFDDGVVTTKPTCTVKGVKTYTCKVCGDTTTEDIDELGHDPIAHEGKKATCTEGGYEPYETCSRCDHTTYKEIESLGHTGGTATCVDKAVCERCGEEYGEVSTTNHIGETELRLAKPATEEAAGYTGDLYCLTCEGLIKKGKVIPKINVDDYNDDYEDKDSYHISVGLYEGGKVSVSDKDPEVGDTVRLTIKADDGYAIQKLIVLNSKGKEIKLTKKGNGYYFEMPASNVSVKASFILLGDEEENPNTGAC